MKTSAIGSIDIIGNLVMPMKEFHVDPYKEETLGFFKKISYYDRLKEINESQLQSLSNHIRNINYL